MTVKEKKDYIRKLAAEMLPEFTLTFCNKNSSNKNLTPLKVTRIQSMIKRIQNEIGELTVKKSRKQKHMDMLMCLSYALVNYNNKEFTLQQIGKAMKRHHTTLIYHVGVVNTMIKLNADLRDSDISMVEFIDKINNIINNEKHEETTINI